MQNEDYSLIEAQIGYEFNNRMLLQQAFTRKSYTNETHDGDNNEVLEFIGDKVLDLVIVKALSEYYGDVNARDEYECEYSEGKLTEIKKSLVGSKMLSARIDELGFTDFLNGNPRWTCECSIKDFNESYYQTCRSKKEAKKQAAYQLLLAILESENGGNQ